MPPTFLYLAALLVYVGFALLVWSGCLLAALWAPARLNAQRTAVAMLCSFPGTVAAQLIAVPVVGTILLLAFGVLIWRTDSSAEYYVATRSEAMVAATVALAAVIAVMTASLYGFVVGWRAGWQVAGGLPLLPVMRRHRPLRWMLSVRGGWLEQRITEYDQHRARVLAV